MMDQWKKIHNGRKTSALFVWSEEGDMCKAGSYSRVCSLCLILALIGFVILANLV